jgi:hypothetical protein
MPLLTYQDARPWAKAIRTAVALRKMPPWFADPRYGHFANDASMAQVEMVIPHLAVSASLRCGQLHGPV